MTLLLVLLICASCAAGDFLYVGTESSQLYLLNFDSNSGSIALKTTLTIVPNPSFIALHSAGQYLYVVSEVDDFNGLKDSGGIAAYKINNQNGNLTLVNKPVPSLGGSPAYIGLDLTNKWIGVANYGGGNYGIWKILDDHSIEEKPTSFFQDHGKGPMPQQDGPHAHAFVFNPSNSFAVIPDLGTDSWMQYYFDPNSGQLRPFSEPLVKGPAGSGPRHIAFHPKLSYAYGVSEIASTVTVFQVERNVASPLVSIQMISTLPSGPISAAAELQFSPDGRVLYVSNRYVGLNGTIAIFSIDQTSGKLMNIGYTDTGGVYPRFFTLSKDGKFFLVANQLSNNIRVFERNAVSGMIGKLVGSVDNIIQPSHILQV